MKLIPLSQGLFTMIDDADFESVSAFKWCAYKDKQRFIAGRGIKKPDGSYTTLLLHRFLMPGVPQIDHEDGNGLNNQRYNIRPATSRQNNQGFKRKRARATSVYRGVSWNSGKRKWEANIQANGRQIYLGCFVSETDAAREYDAAARTFFGAFASPNFPKK